MAWSKADLPATDRANFALDRPAMLGANAVGGTCKWTTTGNDGAADQRDPGPPIFAAARAFDGYDDLVTKPNASLTTWYFNINVGAGTGVFDSFALLYHNLGSQAVQLELQIADDAAFATRLATILTITAASMDGSDLRLLAFTLKEGVDTYAQRFSGVQYARLKLTKGAGFIPYFGECYLSKRRQLEQWPNEPFDPANFLTVVESFESASGVVTNYVRSKKRRKLNAVFNPWQSGPIDDLVDFFLTDLDGGVKPFLWVENPSTAPQVAYWMKLSKTDLESPLIGPLEREIAIEALEHGPNYFKLGR